MLKTVEAGFFYEYCFFFFFIERVNFLAYYGWVIDSKSLTDVQQIFLGFSRLKLKELLLYWDNNELQQDLKH